MGEDDRSASRAARLPLSAGLTLMVATGFVDVYTYLAHGGVFAEAMTGNFVLIGVGIFDHRAVAFWHPLTAVLAFLVGVGLTQLLSRRTPQDSRVPQLITLVVEVGVLVGVGFLPDGVPSVFITSAIALASGLQIAAFRRLGRAQFTTTVMTTNALHAADAVWRAVHSGAAEDRAAAGRLVAGVGAFFAGVLVGGLLTHLLGSPAAWVVAGVFLIAGLLYWRRSGAGQESAQTGR